MAVRIIHTADVHLDSTFDGRLGVRKGRAKREAILSTFRRIIDDCLAWPADMLVIAGDLFEEERVSRTTIAFLREQFARLKDTPVIIAPGNHDPFVQSGRYALTDWSGNVKIFRAGAQESFAFPSIGVEVHGVAHVSTHMAGRLVDVVAPAKGDSAPAMLVAHASDETAVPPDQAADVWLPFTRSEVERLGFAYIALGHYHVPSDLTAGERVVAAYPGSPEGLRASEAGRRHYARVTLDRGGARVERVPVSQIDYADIDIPCDCLPTKDAFVKAVLELAVDSPSSTIARIRATGRVAPGFDLSGGLPDELYERFFYVSIDDRTVPAYDWEAIAAERTLRGEVARRFAAEMAKADAASRPVLEKARLYAMGALDGAPVELPPEVTEVPDVD